MKKIFFLISLVIIFIFLLNLKNIYKILPVEKKIVVKNFVLEKYENLSDKSKILIRVLNLEPFKQLQIRYKRLNPDINNLNNDYNVKFLPLTQADKFNLSKYKINFKKAKNTKNDTGYGFFKPFFIEIFNDNLIVINNNGEILFSPLDKFFKKNKDNLDFKTIKTNLKPDGTQNSKIMGTLTHKEKIYISHINYENNCQIYNISHANINLENLIFENFFKSKSCGENLNAGRMKVLNFNGSDGLLATIGGEKLNEPSGKPQDLNSDIGKLIFIDFKTKKKKIYSIGHRNPQGLFVENDLIIATEHGPKGGDEINKIIYGKNYGWPIASYGKAYDHVKKNKDKKYLNDHSSNNFKEPIFSFVPSIGISEIIKIPNKFSTNWHENFLLASLNGGSLYRIRFNSTFEKIIYKERIFVNKRIRDLKYSDKYNAVILALEDWKEIGILKQITKD
jgi:hypothetical protein